jgi:hypothetical protein
MWESGPAGKSGVLGLGLVSVSLSAVIRAHGSIPPQFTIS